MGVVCDGFVQSINLVKCMRITPLEKENAISAFRSYDINSKLSHLACMNLRTEPLLSAPLQA
jgi:hypothetical protein